MKYYETFLELQCLSKKDIEEIAGSEATAESVIYFYLRKGLIERVKRDLYAVISLETRQPIASRYHIASKLSADACISHHSAFEFYGYANQVFYEVYVTSTSRFRDFVYDGVSYHRMSPKGDGDVVTVGDVRVTSLERTVIDSIKDMERTGGLEELVRCLLLIPALDEERLLKALHAYELGLLYQKSGYVLSSLNDSLKLSPGFFEQCRKNSSDSRGYLAKERNGYVLHPEWKLYAPADLQQVISKGVDYDAV